MGQELVSTERAGAVDTRAQDLGAFPTDAFSFTPPATAVPVLTLKKPWLFSATNVIFKVATSADYTVLDDDGYTDVYVSTGASNRTITLPLLANNQGRVIKIYKTDSGVGEVIIDGNGAETVDRFTTIRVGLQYQTLTIVGASSGWYILSGPLQPVALEPSLGTPHPHEYNFYSAASVGAGSTTLNAISTGGCPTGTKMIYLSFQCNFAGSPSNMNIRDMGTEEWIQSVSGNAAGSYCAGNGLVQVDGTGQFIMYLGQNATGLSLKLHAYWI